MAAPPSTAVPRPGCPQRIAWRRGCANGRVTGRTCEEKACTHRHAPTCSRLVFISALAPPRPRGSASTKLEIVSLSPPAFSLPLSIQAPPPKGAGLQTLENNLKGTEAISKYCSALGAFNIPFFFCASHVDHVSFSLCEIVVNLHYVKSLNLGRSTQKC